MLILLSGFFSSSETAMMALNRYRLKHLARHRHRGAMRSERLLSRPDRLIGIVLLGNNLVNNLAAAITTVLALRFWGDAGIALGAGLLTLVVLIFAEVTPKTLAALHPERVAFPASLPLSLLLYVGMPFVWLVNLASNSLLRGVGVRPEERADDRLSAEEMKTVIYEAGGAFSSRHRNMLLRILELNEVVVEDVMVPRPEVEYLDLSHPADEVREQILTSPYTRLPLCVESLDNVVGVLNLRRASRFLSDPDFSVDSLRELAMEPLFVPDGTPLSKQLLRFQGHRTHLAIVVNEYGDTIGIVTLEDVLEEIVGEFTDKALLAPRDVHPQEDGSYLVEGSATIRELNRRLGWELPTDGAKTLNGAILEHLQDMPTSGLSIKLAGYPVEIVQTKGNAVKIARVAPRPDAPQAASNG